MQRIVIVIMVLIFGTALPLNPHNGTPAVQAQPNVPSVPNTLYYLPLIAGKSVNKAKSGIHLGNRGEDWQDAFLQRIQPPPDGASDGQWPAAVVILSDQIYMIERSTGSPCRVSSATVKQTNGQEYAVYDYLTRAVQEGGTIVVIRLTPSPGNFSDYAQPGGTHNLLIDDTPAGGDYCGGDQSQKANKYRDIRDLASEMDAIHQVNIQHGWSKDAFYFETANEPNAE